MASKVREKIMLLSTGKSKPVGKATEGKATGYFYTTIVNKRNMSEKGIKLELMKFDPRAWNEETQRLGKKVLFKQKKIPK